MPSHDMTSSTSGEYTKTYIANTAVIDVPDKEWVVII